MYLENQNNKHNTKNENNQKNRNQAQNPNKNYLDKNNQKIIKHSCEQRKKRQTLGAAAGSRVIFLLKKYSTPVLRRIR
jgi:hypothetical protein